MKRLRCMLSCIWRSIKCHLKHSAYMLCGNRFIAICLTSLVGNLLKVRRVMWTFLYRCIGFVLFAHDLVKLYVVLLDYKYSPSYPSTLIWWPITCLSPQVMWAWVTWTSSCHSCCRRSRVSPNDSTSYCTLSRRYDSCCATWWLICYIHLVTLF